MKTLEKKLFELQDKKYRDFHLKLIPTVDPERVIGIRTPQLRQLAKEMRKTGQAEAFIGELPHRYFDEDQIHAFIISEIKDFDEAVAQVDRLLPYIDNWATCDQLSPKVFRRHKDELMEHIDRWMGSGEPFAVRFGIKMLMDHFLDDEHFDVRYPQRVCAVRSDEYYVKMMVAWYFATALALQYEGVLPFIEERRLEKWTHNKAIQKARESYRITPEQKAYLKTLKE